MAFSLTPKLAISLLLSLMFMSAFSAEAACCGRQKRNSTTTITGYFPNNTLQNGTFSYFSDGIFTQPNLNSTRKTLWRGAVVRTSPNNFYVVGEYSNVTDDFGNRYSGVFPEYGAWNQSSSVSQVRVASGTGDFSNVTGNSYYQPYENELIVAVGKGEPALVMSEYGFKKVLSLDEYASYFKDIDPVAQYKMWRTKEALYCSSHLEESVPRYDVYSDRVSAAFVVSDPVDWGRDIQVLCDILRSGGIPGWKNGNQPPLYFAADDLEYQAAFPSQRLGMGAFRIALESIFNRIHHSTLEYVSFGKPNPFVFKNSEALLAEFRPSQYDDHITNSGCSHSHGFRTLYMIGDNPLVDVKGAQQAGHPWFSILTRTGVFKGKDNHKEFPADMVVDTVEEAVDFILKREGTF